VIPGFARNVFVPYAEMLGDAFRRGMVVDLNTEKKKLVLDDEGEVSCQGRFIICAPPHLL